MPNTIFSVLHAHMKKILSTRQLEVMCKVEGTYKLSISYYKLVVVGQRGLLRGHRPCHMYGWGTFREKVM